MKYNDLQVEKNTRPSRKGRGISAGQGKTAGRGTKGQKARTGHRKMPAGFMGGQRAIMQAVPKLKGFKSIHKKAEVVYTDRLGELKGKVDNIVLADKGLISNPYGKVKVILRGEVANKIDLETQFASKSAIEAIKKAGGSFKKVAILKRPVNKTEKQLNRYFWGFPEAAAEVKRPGPVKTGARGATPEVFSLAIFML